jgi:hypothetical protein
MDLVFFERILEMAESGISRRNILEVAAEEIFHHQSDYELIEYEVCILDNIYGIGYDALPNPFLGEF